MSEATLAQRYYERRKYPEQQVWGELRRGEQALWQEVVDQVLDVSGLAAALELLSDALNDLFHVLISEFDRDPMDCVEDYLPWTAERQFALRLALAAAAPVEETI